MGLAFRRKALFHDKTSTSQLWDVVVNDRTGDGLHSFLALLA